MRRRRLAMKVLVLVLILGVVTATSLFLEDDAFSVRHAGEHRDYLLQMAHRHYLKAALLFAALFFMTAFFLPGALALTIAGGMLFGALPATLYVTVAGTAGAIAAFEAGRFLLGHWVQRHFAEQLSRFNREMTHHGPHYLLVLRLLPLAPFCVINYGAALTKIPLKTFAWTTVAGMLPGSAIYAFAGAQLRYVHEVSDLWSGKSMLAIGLLAISALVPVLLHHWPRREREG
ncbi:TVP38/TMEM64 family protein [Citrifermentans bremense]|uniref:TVP38/TMEM64 family membrane protein n=2 Tax=Citrifermentans bremense TaxID=60035 RepID=A0A6S6M503_9BACT|nr:VTT domain-containing protein [Citrifermentans bremense]